MKLQHLVWLLATAVRAVPIVEPGQATVVGIAGPGPRFGVDREFHITMFADLHFGEESWPCPTCKLHDSMTTKVMNDILQWERTDLAVLNGDLLSAEAVSANDYVKYIHRIVKPLVSRKIPWASTYGNHDRDKNTLASEILKTEHQYNSVGTRLAWTQSNVPGEDSKVGTTNYFVPVYSSSGGATPNLVLMLWFFDSRAGTGFQQDGKLDDFVAPEVVAWYNAQQAAFKKTYNRIIPSLAFVHIPFKASSDLQKLRKENDAFAPGIDAEAIGHQATPCDPAGNNCNYQGGDVPFTKALVESEGVMAVFSSHNHRVDWCMKWDKHIPGSDPPIGNGLNVCFGRRTGYGGYGKEYRRGARHIRIYEDDLDKRVVQTWNRLEDGNISGSITLNATYGTDKYPPAPQQGRQGADAS